MKPDRELDKMIAEIIGTLPIPDPPGTWWPRSLEIKPYSTDITAAWKAWEWINENAPHVPILRTFKDKPVVIFVQEAWIEDEFLQAEVKAIIKGESYALAICNAVLWVKDNG